MILNFVTVDINKFIKCVNIQFDFV